MKTRNPDIPAKETEGEVQRAVYPVFGRPLVPATLAFIAGILSADSVWLLTAGLMVIAGISLHSRSRISLVVLMGFYCLGAARTAVSSAPGDSDISRYIGAGYVTVTGSIASDPEYSRFTSTAIVRALEIQTPDGVRYPVSGQLLLRFPRDVGIMEYGDVLEARGPLQHPESADNPGLFRYPDYLARMGVYASMNVRRAESVKRIHTGGPGSDVLARLMQRSRQSLVSTFDRVLPRIKSNLLAGIVLGQRTRLPAEVKDDFAATGTTHILASSGMNVGIVAASVFWIARMLRVGKRRAVWLVIPAMLLYSLLAGAKPSVIRADIMATSFLLAGVFDREPDFSSSIALAAMALLTLNPHALADPGFQLSFAAVIALVACMPLIDPHMRAALGIEGRPINVVARIRHLLMSGFIVSLIAQIATLPLTAQHFNQVSLSGILANAFIVAAIPFLLYGGLLLWLAGMVIPPAAVGLTWILGFPLAYVLGAARFFGSFQFAVLSVSSPGWLLISLYYLAGGFLLWRIRAAHIRTELAS